MMADTHYTFDLRNYFNTGVTRSLTYRQQQLSGIKRFLVECESEILTALKTDLGKPPAEAFAAEIGLLLTEVKLAQRHLFSWSKAKRVPTNLLAQPGKSYICPEPLGVVLIISPWNYPIQLALAPLIGAIAAGNCVVIKPSELAQATSHLLATKLTQYLDKLSVFVVEGGVAETTSLLSESFDHIFYTGNGTVGRIVMTAAAKNLTPVTLELGGKSPCIVDHDANLEVAARRIIWAKFSNAGQTCVAPDYVLVHEAIEQKLIECMQKVLFEFYGKNPESSPDYGRIVNEHHFQRLMKLLSGSGDVVTGGNGNEAERYFAPTLLRNVPANAPIMAEEIFGPILPILTVKNNDAAIAFINSHPKPLALYVFTENKQTYEHVIANTSSGSVSVNFPMMQLVVPSLPFGGVGASGMGAYHGKASFMTFSHYKSILIKKTWLDLSIMYPPYSAGFMRLIRWLT